MCLDFSTPGAIFLFFVLVGLLNMLLKLASRSLTGAVGTAAAALIAYLCLYWPFAAIDLYAPGLILSSFLESRR